MQLTHLFADPLLNLTLELLLRDLSELFRERLLMVLLYGSVTQDDLAPGYGDLDFLAIVDGDLSLDECKRLRQLRQPLRSGAFGQLAGMLEGAFLPWQMLDPLRRGSAYWWGTSGERCWQANQLGPFCLQQIKVAGVVVHGLDLRAEIPSPARSELVAEATRTCRGMQQHAGEGGLMTIDWLFTAARLLCWAATGESRSKSQAAAWALTRAKGEWRNSLPQALHLRQHPRLLHDPAQLSRRSELEAAIRAAAAEALAAIMGLSATTPPSGEQQRQRNRRA